MTSSLFKEPSRVPMITMYLKAMPNYLPTPPPASLIREKEVKHSLSKRLMLKGGCGYCKYSWME